LRLLHVSDLHLHWEEPRASFETVEAIAQAAVSNQADAVLIAGDIFDTAAQPEEFVRRVLRPLVGLTPPVVAIPGNHDLRYAANELDLLELLPRLLGERHRLIADPVGESVTLLRGALHVWGRGMLEHTPENLPLDGARSFGEASWNVVIAHGELLETNRLQRSSPIVLDRHLPALEGVDYLALGHHDAPSQTTFRGTLVCYSGSASPLLGPGVYALVELGEESGVTATCRNLEFATARSPRGRSGAPDNGSP
jgi:DNA repair exonuclease SbcCD nuclease subunit